MNYKTMALLAVTAVCISASAVDLPPAPLRDKGRIPADAVRQYEIPGFLNGHATGLTCPIRFIDPYFGYLSSPSYEAEHKAPIGMRCFDSDDGTVRHGWAKFEEAQQRWQVSLPPEDEELFAGKTRIYQLTNSNASGWVVTIDDATGEEFGRRRMLHYCLIHPPKALCGSGEMGYIEDIRRHPKNDLTPYALKILRSIEFLDEPGKPDGAASPASSPH